MHPLLCNQKALHGNIIHLNYYCFINYTSWYVIRDPLIFVHKIGLIFSGHWHYSESPEGSSRDISLPATCTPISLLPLLLSLVHVFEQFTAKLNLIENRNAGFIRSLVFSTVAWVFLGLEQYYISFIGCMRPNIDTERQHTVLVLSVIWTKLTSCIILCIFVFNR